MHTSLLVAIIPLVQLFCLVSGIPTTNDHGRVSRPHPNTTLLEEAFTMMGELNSNETEQAPQATPSKLQNSKSDNCSDSDMDQGSSSKVNYTLPASLNQTGSQGNGEMPPTGNSQPPPAGGNKTSPGTGLQNSTYPGVGGEGAEGTNSTIPGNEGQDCVLPGVGNCPGSGTGAKNTTLSGGGGKNNTQIGNGSQGCPKGGKGCPMSGNGGQNGSAPGVEGQGCPQAGAAGQGCPKGQNSTTPGSGQQQKPPPAQYNSTLPGPGAQQPSNASQPNGGQQNGNGASSNDGGQPGYNVPQAIVSVDAKATVPAILADLVDFTNLNVTEAIYIDTSVGRVQIATVNIRGRFVPTSPDAIINLSEATVLPPRSLEENTVSARSVDTAVINVNNAENDNIKARSIDDASAALEKRLFDPNQYTNIQLPGNRMWFSFITGTAIEAAVFGSMIEAFKTEVQAQINTQYGGNQASVFLQGAVLPWIEELGTSSITYLLTLQNPSDMQQTLTGRIAKLCVALIKQYIYYHNRNCALPDFWLWIPGNGDVPDQMMAHGSLTLDQEL